MRKVLILTILNKNIQPVNRSIPPIKSLIRSLMRNPSICDCAASYSIGEDRWLVLPENYKSFTLMYHIEVFDLSLEPEIETVALGSRLLGNVTGILETNYEEFDGFVIIYPEFLLDSFASDLSYSLENLAKPVIILESKVNIFSSLKSFEEQLKSCIIISGVYEIPEVCVYTNNRLLRGNRVTRDIDSTYFSPNFPPLGEFADGVFRPNWLLIRSIRPEDHGKLQVFRKFNRKINHFRYHPNICPEFLKLIFEDPECNTIVIESYGIGNLPQKNATLLEILKDSLAKSKIIFTVTQCVKGFLTPIYETNFTKLGINSGHDMTITTILSKLSYLGGKYSTREEILYHMDQNLRGEVTLRFVHDDHRQHKDMHYYFTNYLNTTPEIKSKLFNELIRQPILFTAFKESDPVTLKALCWQGLTCKSLFSEGNNHNENILHIFAKGEASEKAREMFQILKENAKCDIGQLCNQYDDRGNLPIVYAVMNKNRAKIMMLKDLTKERILTDKNKDEVFQFLNQCIKEDDIDGIKCLIVILDNLNELKNAQGLNFAHLAVINRNVRVLEFIKSELDETIFDESDLTGMKAADYAAKINDPDVRRFFKAKI